MSNRHDNYGPDGKYLGYSEDSSPDVSTGTYRGELLDDPLYWISFGIVILIGIGMGVIDTTQELNVLVSLTIVLIFCLVILCIGIFASLIVWIPLAAIRAIFFYD